MAKTLAELQQELTTVEAAISLLITGKRVTHLEIGTGLSKRIYKYAEITLDALQSEKARIISEMSSLEGTTVLPKFQEFTTIPLTMNKRAY